MKITITLFICFFFAPPLLFGAEQYVVVTEPFEPLSYIKEEKITGISTEIVKQVFKQAGIEAPIRMYPWKRSYNYAREKENYFIYSILRNEKREDLFQWIGPILWRTVSLYRLKERTDIVVNSIEDMKKYRVGVQDGESMHQILIGRGFEDGKHLFPVINSNQNMEKFFLGRVDLIYFNNYTGASRLNKFNHSMDEVEKILVLEEGGYYIGANKGIAKEVVQRLQSAVDTVKASGFVEKTVARYLH